MGVWCGQIGTLAGHRPHGALISSHHLTVFDSQESPDSHDHASQAHLWTVDHSPKSPQCGPPEDLHRHHRKPRTQRPRALRSQHIKGSLLPTCRDETAGHCRRQHSLLGCLLDRQCLTHGTEKKDRRHRPVAEGETAGHYSEDMTPNAAGIRTKNSSESHRPRHQTMAPGTRQRRKTMPLDRELGASFQPN